MTVHREQSMKTEDQKYATIRCLLLTSVSTCFGYHYAYHQENKGPVTAFGALLCFCWKHSIVSFLVGLRTYQEVSTMKVSVQLFIINFCLNMFRASLCPSSGDQRPCYCIWFVVLVLLDVVDSGCGAHAL